MFFFCGRVDMGHESALGGCEAVVRAVVCLRESKLIRIMGGWWMRRLVEERGVRPKAEPG